MKERKKPDHEGINYWESTTDLLAALLLILLLVIMLLFLYLKMFPENDEIDPDPGDTYTEQETQQETQRETQQNDSNDGGGEDETEEETEEEEHRDDEMKAAIYVKVVDADTGNLIPQSGIKFRLYRSSNNALQVLHDYYPEKTKIEEYETTEEGVFYLPEKISYGDYYLKDMSTITGYMLSPTVDFSVDKSYDWSDPLVITVKLSTVKNIIAIQQSDKDSGDKIAGGVYRIVAAEDVVTQDGTVRLHAGDVAAELTCDENGYAASDELYLGKYQIEQVTVPEYYAGIEQPQQVDLEELSEDIRGDDWQEDAQENSVQTSEILLEKSSVTLQLTDENDGTPLSDIEFEVTCEGDSSYNQKVTTDGNGEFTITDLQKDTIYHFLQKSVSGNYRILQSDLTVSVGSDGRIDGAAQYSLDAKNRIIRVSISLKDKILRTDIVDAALSLYDSTGKLLDNWSSSGGDYVLEDLSEGSYYLTIDGKDDTRYDFDVADTGEVQKVSIYYYSAKGLLILGAAIAVGLLVFSIGAWFLVRMIRRKGKKHEQ